MVLIINKLDNLNRSEKIRKYCEYTISSEGLKLVN